MASKLSFSVFILAVCISPSWQQTDGAPQKICDLPCRETPMEIAFVIDASSSIYPNNFTHAKWFVADFVDIFKIQPDVVRVAAVTYGSRVYRDGAFGFDMYSDKLELKKAIDKIPYKGGNTETGEAIRYMRDRYLSKARPTVKKVCIVLTDGNSQNPNKTEREARKTREMGVEIFSVGIGRDISEWELRNIAGDERHVFEVSSYNLLGTIRSRLAYETCDEQPPWPVVCRDNPIDISLVIDASSSIGHANFSIGLDFLIDFVKSFDVSKERALFSAITYGNGTYDDTAFDFNTYTDEVSLVDAIKSIPYTAGDHTDTGLAIAFMRERQMLPNLRPQAAHIAVVLTDGNSQDWLKTQNEAKLSRDTNISMFAIGVGVSVKEDELLKIAGQEDRMFKVSDYEALETIKSELDEKTCTIALGHFSHPQRP